MVTEKLLRVYAIERKPYVEIVYFSDWKCVGHKHYRNVSSKSWDRVSNFIQKNHGGTSISQHSGTVVVSIKSEYM